MDYIVYVRHVNYLWTVIVSVLGEEATFRQGRGAGPTREACSVEVLVGHAQHLAAALAAARAAHHLACKQSDHSILSQSVSCIKY